MCLLLLTLPTLVILYQIAAPRFANTLGTGRWFDSFVQNLIPGVFGSALCGGASQTQVISCSTGGN